MKRSDTWNITTILDPPYTNATVENPTKNEDFVGFVPDLLKKIGSRLGQAYTISVVGDGKYGAKDGGKWTGMIGEVIDKKATVAAAAVTVSDARKEVVSFTDPWLQIRSVVVVRKPTDGSEFKVRSASDLVSLPGIRYGAVREGTTMQLIQNATDPPYLATIKHGLKDLVLTSKEGIRRVQEDADGRFAFVTESATGDYWSMRLPCDLAVFELPLPPREYAFVVAKDSPVKARLDSAIREMKATGEFDAVYRSWWKDECASGGVCPRRLGSILLPVLVVGVVVLVGSD